MYLANSGMTSFFMIFFGLLFMIFLAVWLSNRKKK